MPRTFTVTQLVSRAQKRADMEASDFISDAEWKEYLSSGYAELYSILAASGMRYFEATETITSDGSGSHNLPSDHLSTIGIDRVRSATDRYQLRELMVQERNQWLTGGASEARAYALVGAKIELYPTPPSGQQYEHIYVPQPQDLSEADDGDSVDVVTPDGEQFLSWYMAVMALAKEESDARLAIRERERARERLEEWSTLRAMNTPRRPVVDEGMGAYQDPADFWGRGGGWGW